VLVDPEFGRGTVVAGSAQYVESRGANSIAPTQKPFPILSHRWLHDC
jgi:hypothetical protein